MVREAGKISPRSNGKSVEPVLRPVMAEVIGVVSRTTTAYQHFAQQEDR